MSWVEYHLRCFQDNVLYAFFITDIFSFFLSFCFLKKGCEMLFLFFFVTKCYGVELGTFFIIEKKIDISKTKEGHEFAIHLSHQTPECGAFSHMFNHCNRILLLISHQSFLVNVHYVFKFDLYALTYTLKSDQLRPVELLLWLRFGTVFFAWARTLAFGGSFIKLSLNEKRYRPLVPTKSE